MELVNDMYPSDFIILVIMFVLVLMLMVFVLKCIYVICKGQHINDLTMNNLNGVNGSDSSSEDPDNDENLTQDIQV